MRLQDSSQNIKKQFICWEKWNFMRVLIPVSWFTQWHVSHPLVIGVPKLALKVELSRVGTELGNCTWVLSSRKTTLSTGKYWENNKCSLIVLPQRHCFNCKIPHSLMQIPENKIRHSKSGFGLYSLAKFLRIFN